MLETVLYAVFVFFYFALVLHVFGDRLKHIFDNNRTLYAFLALALICAQGFLLEILTSALWRVLRRK